MATFALINGAGDVGWYRHLAEAELRERGHDVVAPDLPCEDDSAGLREYADVMVDAIGDHAELVVVAQSFAGFVAPLVCVRLPVELLVLVAGLIPAPGEAPSRRVRGTSELRADRSSCVPPRIRVDRAAPNLTRI
jgi:pimeloyl-ACP methyl ester carboxylesterase